MDGRMEGQRENMHYLSSLPPSPPVLTLQSDMNTEQILEGTEKFWGLI